ncbi:MAG TPA: hypothetical protein VIL49_10450 [Capillimicrobium sp.]|jgi:hypothetical protein
MRRPLAPLTAAAALAAAGCGGGGGSGDALAPVCQEGADAIVQALATAPEPVTLSDGATPISECVTAASTSDADLQSIGLILSSAGEQLARDGDAVALGYLVGAARRGSEATAGIALELVRRLESTARQVPAGARAALREGLAAGEATG